MACDAATLLATAITNGYDKLSSRDLKEVILAAACAGGGGSSSTQDMQVAWTPTNLKLGEMLGFFTFGNIPGITSITFNQAHSLSGFDIEGGDDITSLAWPNLVDIDPSNTQGGFLSINGLAALTSISIPLLSILGGGGIVITGTAIQSLSLPSLVSMPRTFGVSGNSSLTSISVPSFVPTNGKDITWTANALDASSVNAILHRAVLNAGYVSGSVDTSGGTSAAPTGVGLADKATLILRGCTVTTN